MADDGDILKHAVRRARTPEEGEPAFDFLIEGRPLILDVTEVLILSYGVMMIFRSLGFPPEELYFASSLNRDTQPPEVAFYGVSILQPHRQFNVTVAPVDCVRIMTIFEPSHTTRATFCSPEEVKDMWSTFVENVQRADFVHPALRERLGEIARTQTTRLMLRLRDRGFEIPAFEAAALAEHPPPKSELN